MLRSGARVKSPESRYEDDTGFDEPSETGHTTPVKSKVKFNPKITTLASSPVENNLDSKAKEKMSARSSAVITEEDYVDFMPRTPMTRSMSAGRTPMTRTLSAGRTPPRSAKKNEPKKATDVPLTTVNVQEREATEPAVISRKSSDKVQKWLEDGIGQVKSKSRRALSMSSSVEAPVNQKSSMTLNILAGIVLGVGIACAWPYMAAVPYKDHYDQWASSADAVYKKLYHKVFLSDTSCPSGP
ncbi:hypothetical protein HDE_01804 [Halotydeus destructor]|nr:hypothetical protein HDE_01804 [Halotydeus destructor]